MVCSNPTGTTKGILIAYGAGDTGDRPLAANVPFYVTPNIRLALPADVPALQNPANWDTPQYANWNGQVQVNSTYTLMVRVSNTDSTERVGITLEAWVCDFTALGVGPETALLQNPGQPPGPANPPVHFSGFNPGTLAAANPANPDDPASMLVVSGGTTWTPNATQITGDVHQGHVCVAANVYEEDVDGAQLLDPYLDATCDRMFGQRNVQIVTVPQGQHIQIPVVMSFPANGRVPLRAVVTPRPVQLIAGPGGLRHIPELAHAASNHAITELRTPVTNPLQHITIGGGLPGGLHAIGSAPLKLNLEPGQRTNLALNLDAQNLRPGDTYAMDFVTTDSTTGRPVGGARVYALVTA
jgi:hypothetical protein